MGNSGSDKKRLAISQETQQIVKKVGILTANESFLDTFINKMKPVYEREISKGRLQKQNKITDTRKLINEKYQEKKKTLQSEETGMIQYIEYKHSMSFGALSEYDEALQKLKQFQNRTNEIYTVQKHKLVEDIERYKQDLKYEIEKLKTPLPALNSLGPNQKNKILDEVAAQNPEEVEQSNRHLKQQFQNQLGIEQSLRKRCQQWVPQTQLNQIVTNFQKSLQKITSKKVNNFLGCF